MLIIESIIFLNISLLFLIYNVHYFILFFFGKNISFEQIIWTISRSKKGSITSFLLTHLIIFVLVLFTGITLLSFFIFNIDYLLNFFNPTIIFLILFIIIFISFLILVLFCNTVNKKYSITDYFLNKNSYSFSEFIKNNYVIPSKSEISFKTRKNIVIVLAESLETTFSGMYSNNRFNYIPKLIKQQKTGQYVSNYLNTTVSGYTIGALTAWHFGLPLKLPDFISGNEYGKKDFLPNAISIFDVLRNHNYQQTLLMGTDARFGGQLELFKKHGNFNIKDEFYWKHVEKIALNEKNKGCWAYTDKFVLNKAKEEYIFLKQNSYPFVLFIETIDTHAPNGFCPQEKKQYNDIRDAYIELDDNLTDFIDFMKQNMDDNTVFMVIGDHCFMGEPSFFNKKDLNNRKIYNAFWGNLPKNRQVYQNKYVTAFDIAPTILQCAGASWSNYKFGLGTSIFSSEFNLSKNNEFEYLNNELMKKSKFYSKFY